MKIFSPGLVLLIFLTHSLGAGPQEELNQELRKELGIQDKKVEPTKGEPLSREPSPEANPVRERYAVPSDEDTSLLWILVRITFVFAILAGIFYYALRFLSKNRDARFPVKGLMRVLSSLPLANGKEVQILDVGGMLFVLGLSENGITLIKEIESPEIKEKVYQVRDTAEPPQDAFVDVLLKHFKGTDTLKAFVGNLQKSAPPNEDDVVEEIKSKQIERLDRLRRERQDILKKDVDTSEFRNYV
jgi:flagellar protein FliO/FliZ